MIGIIGSGPAAAGAAAALVKRGIPATVIDPGFTLEAPNSALKERLASAEPSQWRSEDVKHYTSSIKPSATGIPKKLVYGSDFPYRQATGAVPLEIENAKVLRSLAHGGFANVWGANILPFPASELDGWPVTAEELAPHFREVLSFVPLTARRDGIGGEFPLYTEEVQELQPNGQVKEILCDLDRSREKLGRARVHFGASRLALKAKDCRYCGLCLYGCPYDLIYSSHYTLAPLIAQKALSYVSGYYVDRVCEEGSGARVIARSVSSGALQEFRFSKVFVAAGVVESARIILESLEAYEKPLTIRHSDRFMLPFFRFRRTRGIRDEKLNTLCQLFLELAADESNRRSIHLQVYTYNDLYLQALRGKLGAAAAPLAPALHAAVERLIVLFGYLHSDISSHLHLSVGRAPQRVVRINGVKNDAARRAMWRTYAKLLGLSTALRGVPAWPFLDPPGGGNHSGGTLPMRKNPKEFESDVLGRPYGFRHVHVLDSSVLPNISAATITLTAMANAHRIATYTEL